MNPTDNVLKELKKAYCFDVEKKHALTLEQQNLFINYIKNTPHYKHWYPVFAVMIGTGMRVGETVGLRWCDIDLEEGIIDVNHTIVYYNHGDHNGCTFGINTPKTKAGNRTIPMMDFVKEAFKTEKKYQEEIGLSCVDTVDMYTDFIFVNKDGKVQHAGNLNKAIRRIVRDCNYDVLQKGEENPVLLPLFSCHTLRHTFTTRLCESGMNIKVIQDVLGHADIQTTLNIYADVTKDKKMEEFDNLSAQFSEMAV